MNVSKEKLIDDLKSGWKHGDHARVAKKVGVTKQAVRDWFNGGNSEYEADILKAAAIIQAERLRIPPKARKAARSFYAAKKALPVA